MINHTLWIFRKNRLQQKLSQVSTTVIKSDKRSLIWLCQDFVQILAIGKKSFRFGSDKTLYKLTLSIVHLRKWLYEASTFNERITVKVSKSQKQIMVTSILPKNEQKITISSENIRVSDFLFIFWEELRTPSFAFDII